MIQTAFPGDMVLTLPLLQRLARRHGPVDVVTTPAAAPLLTGHPAVGEVISFDKRGADRGLAGTGRLARTLRQRRYARVYLPHRSLRSAVLGWLSGAPDRIGYGGKAGALLYSRRVPWANGEHESRRLLGLGGEGGESDPEWPGPDPSRDWLALTPPERARAEAWLEVHGIRGGFLVLAPGSRWGSKRWPFFADLAVTLEGPYVVVGGGEDQALAEAVAHAAPGRGVSAAGTLPLREAAAVIARAELVVTNDSLPLHLATATGRPVLALFGPTVPGFGFGPIGRGDMVLERPGLPCRPCSRHGPPACPLGHHRCLREITVGQVRAAIAARLGTA